MCTCMLDFNGENLRRWVEKEAKQPHNACQIFDNKPGPGFMDVLVRIDTSTNKLKACGTFNFSLAVSVIKRQ
jgi:hypothetical protein